MSCCSSQPVLLLLQCHLRRRCTTTRDKRMTSCRFRKVPSSAFWAERPTRMMVSGRESSTAWSASSPRFWWRISRAAARTETDKETAVHRYVSECSTMRGGMWLLRWMWLYPDITTEFEVSSCPELTNTPEQERTLITDSVETEMLLLNVWFAVVEAQTYIWWDLVGCIKKSGPVFIQQLRFLHKNVTK